jgi:adenylate kinase
VRSILIGPPGAGKGTQAHKLAAKFAIPHIFTGQLFRESVGAGTKLGMAAKHYLAAGDHALVADRLSQPDCRRHGFIRDGYPRSLEQAEAVSRTLAARDTSIDAALKF